MTHPLSPILRRSARAARALDRSVLLNDAADELDRLNALNQNTDIQALSLEKDRLESALLRLSTKTAEYEPVLQLIAVGPRSDGTYNYCRDACRQLAIKALSYE